MGYKAYSDSYLMSLTKPQIIELLRIAEHNFFATEEALNNSAKVGTEIAEKYDRAKELLRMAVEDIHDVLTSQRKITNYTLCEKCKHYLNCNCKDKCIARYNLKQWRFADEALKLIEG